MKLALHGFSSLMVLFTLAGCSTSHKIHPSSEVLQEVSQQSERAFFLSIRNQDPEKIWAPGISEKVKASVKMYQDHALLQSGTHYGDSVRSLNLSEKTADQINRELSKKNCESRNEVIRQGGVGEPVRDSTGQTIPMITWLCKDGGVVRIKPKGDSSSRFLPQPHASKALRYPYDSKYETFDDETVKVDNLGNPIPKWTKDLNQEFEDPKLKAKFIQGWADDAHTNIIE